MFENYKDWAISIEAPVKWRTFRDYNTELETTMYSPLPSNIEKSRV